MTASSALPLQLIGRSSMKIRAKTGLLNLLGDLTDNWRPPPYGFNKLDKWPSRTPSALSVRSWRREISSSNTAVNGTVVITATTVGSRKAFAFVFTIPPIAVAFILFCLMATTRTPKDALEGEFLSSSELPDLIQLGRIQRDTERQRHAERQRDTEIQRHAERQREMETERDAETERDTETGQETEDDLLDFAAPHGQLPDEERGPSQSIISRIQLSGVTWKCLHADLLFDRKRKREDGSTAHLDTYVSGLDQPCQVAKAWLAKT